VPGEAKGENSCRKPTREGFGRSKHGAAATSARASDRTTMYRDRVELISRKIAQRSLGEREKNVKEGE